MEVVPRKGILDGLPPDVVGRAERNAGFRAAGGEFVNVVDKSRWY